MSGSRLGGVDGNAVIHSIVAPDWLGEQIAALYPLDVPLTCQLIQSGASDRYLVRTPAASFVARVSTAGALSISESGYEAGLLEHLAARGIPVPRAICTRSGESAVSLEAPGGTRTLGLFTTLEGRRVFWDTEQRRRLAGRMLASVHRASADFTTSSPRRHLDLEHLFHTPVRVIGDLLEHREDDRDRFYALTSRIEKLAKAEVAKCRDWGACYGNLRQQNLRVTETGEVIFVEWGDCGPGWRAFDMAMACRSGFGMASDPLWRAFLDGYLEVRDVSSGEVDALPIFHLLSRLWRLGNGSRLYLSSKTIDRLFSFLVGWETDHMALAHAASSVRPTVARACRDSRSADAPFEEARIVRSVLSGGHVMAEVSDLYDLDDLSKCRLLQSSSNDTYLLTTPKARYVARVYPVENSDLSAIRFEMDFLRHLRARGVPVSSALPNRQGALVSGITAPEGTRTAAVFEFCEGKMVSWTEERFAHLSGRLAASIHQGSEGFATSHSKPQWDLERIADRPIATLEPFLAHRRKDWEDLRDIAQDLKSQVARLEAQGISRAICHGDFNAKNIHVTSGESIGIFDFDFCGMAWAAFDAIWIFHAATNLRRPDIWNAFLRGYREVGDLTPPDVKLIPLLIGLMNIWVLDHDARRVVQAGLYVMGDDRLDAKIANARNWYAGLVKHETVGS